MSAAMSPLVAKFDALKATPLYRGLTGHCPRCGRGSLFRAFLKVNDACPACGEEMHHHRADDFPAYLVVVIVGHVVVALALIVEAAYAPPLWLHAAIWLPLTVAFALLLIQPVKGAVIAFQWQHGMEGFASAKKTREAHAI